MQPIVGVSGEFRLRIRGMTCSSCVEIVTAALREVPGVHSVAVELRGGLARVTAIETIGVKTLVEAVNEAGYKASEV